MVHRKLTTGTLVDSGVVCMRFINQHGEHRGRGESYMHFCRLYLVRHMDLHKAKFGINLPGAVLNHLSKQ